MREHKHLKRLKRLHDAVLDYCNGDPNSILSEDEGLCFRKTGTLLVSPKSTPGD